MLFDRIFKIKPFGEREERLYSVLLLVYFLGAVIGAFFAAYLYNRGIVINGFLQSGKSIYGFIAELGKALICPVFIVFFALFPSGAGLIPVLFLSKGAFDSYMISRLVIESGGEGLYTAIITQSLGIIVFLTLIVRFAVIALGNSISIISNNGAIRFKNLYLLVNPGSAAFFAFSLVTLTLTAFIQFILSN